MKQDRPNYKVFTYVLSVGETVTINHRANSLNCLAADASFKIGFGDAPLTVFERGLGYRAEVPFEKIRLLNDGVGAISVQLGFASGGVTDSRLTLSGNLSAAIYGGATLAQGTVSALPTATTGVAGINLTRNEILITNNGAATVYLGGATVTNGTGLPLAPAATATLTTTGAISVYNPGGVAAALAYLELSA